ncbi:membrane protein [Streptococcus pneumoniae]|nr:TBC1 domain family member 8B [Streptococcus pneumoniae]VLG16370.1 membrane protein [Streptococcus pneumoniae]
MSNYRRTSKPKTEHIKKGFTVFQKTITTIGSILGLITAGITIMNALDNNNNKNTKKEPTTSQTTTFVKEIQKESPQENTTPNKENNTSQEKTQQEETPKSSVKEEKKKIRKQQLRTLLHLLQVNLPLKMKNSPILQLQKIILNENQRAN